MAIKAILPHLANNPDFIRRFDLEAELVAKLEHPHIVPLYDYWREPDGAYLVMRWLSGGLRAALARDGRWGTERTARFLDQIAEALTVAHRNNVIHRDIKPDNILLDEDGNAYLADFGIAKDYTSSYETKPEQNAFSPSYAAPEQWLARPVTAQTDLYSLGVVLFEMLTGSHPYPATEIMELWQKHVYEPLPALDTLRDDLPRALDNVLQRVTEKDPEDRYPTALRLAEAFRAALGHQALSPRSIDIFALETGDDLLFEVSTVKEVLLEPENPYKGLRAFQEEIVVALGRIAMNRLGGLAEELQENERGLLLGVRRSLPDDSGELLLVIDQFEEVFTQVEDEAARTHFPRQPVYRRHRSQEPAASSHNAARGFL